MNRNHIEDQWRQCHWKEWREIKARWNESHKSGEAHAQEPDGVMAAEFEWRDGRSPSVEPGSNSTAFGPWSGGHSVDRSFPTGISCNRD